MPTTPTLKHWNTGKSIKIVLLLSLLLCILHLQRQDVSNTEINLVDKTSEPNKSLSIIFEDAEEKTNLRANATTNEERGKDKVKPISEKLGHNDDKSTVSCGGHHAPTCEQCPHHEKNGEWMGKSYCHGECKWQINKCLSENDVDQRSYQEIWNKDTETYESIPDSAKQFTKRLDDTLLLNFPAIKKRALVGSAILMHPENMVAFIVVDNPNGIEYETDEIKREELPDGLLCGFGNIQSNQTPNEFITSIINDSATSPLNVYANRLQYYKSSSIWTCPLPNDSEEYNSVAILTPSSVKVVAGTGVFHIQRPDAYANHDNSSPSVVSCVAK